MSEKLSGSFMDLGQIVLNSLIFPLVVSNTHKLTSALDPNEFFQRDDKVQHSLCCIKGSQWFTILTLSPENMKKDLITQYS